MKHDEPTHFGFETVTAEEKTSKVNQVFESVASRYDVMNDLMSLGLHRLWKRFLIRKAHLKPGQVVLDLAGGTGDVTRRIAKKVLPEGRVVLADLTLSMLKEARTRALNQGLFQHIDYVQANAEALPFAENTFDCVTMAFGLRNVTDKPKALSEIFRVLKPGGQALILEFSELTLESLRPMYDAYSFKILPKLGKLIARDEESYRYLAESIRMHPNQDALKHMMEEACFANVDYHNLTAGVVALHTGLKDV